MFNFLVMLAVILPWVARAEPSGSAGNEWTVSTIRSPSGRFFVTADDPGDRMLLSRWADDVYRRFQKAWQPAVALPPERVFDIIVDAEHRSGMPGSVVTRRSIRGQRINLGLRIERVASLDVEAFVEALCGMLLDALILEAQPEEERRLYEENAPHWLSVGVAQNLYPALRGRNQRVVVALWRQGDLPAVDTVLAWHYLSPHRGFQHAVSSVWIVWAAGLWPHPSDALQHWIGYLAGGWPITPERLPPPGRPGAAAGDGWEPYVASLQRLFTAGDAMGAVERYGRLRRALQVAPGLSGIPYDVQLAGADDGLDALIPLRREPWVERFARSRQNEISGLAAGACPEFQALTEGIGDFLQSLDRRRPRFLLRRDYRRLTEDLDRQEKLAVTREQYVSLFEARRQAERLPVWLADDGLDGPAPSRLRRYVDEFDAP